MIRKKILSLIKCITNFYFRAKQANQERLAQEELSFDLKMLEDALQTYQNEDKEKFERKVFIFIFTISIDTKIIIIYPNKLF